jgi:hypothetical protein
MGIFFLRHDRLFKNSSFRDLLRDWSTVLCIDNLSKNIFHESGLGWSRGKGKKAFFGDLKFPSKPVENLLFYLHRVSVGDYLPLKGSQPPKYH